MAAIRFVGATVLLALLTSTRLATAERAQIDFYVMSKCPGNQCMIPIAAMRFSSELYSCLQMRGCVRWNSSPC